jgi:hypothetical protein
LRVGQRDADLTSGAVSVGNGEVRVFGAAADVPGLRVGSPAGQVDISACAVFELQRQVVVRPALDGDVVLAGLDAHADSIKPGLLAQRPAERDQVTRVSVAQ